MLSRELQQPVSHLDEESLKAAKEVASEKDQSYYSGSKTSMDYSGLFADSEPVKDAPNVSKCEQSTAHMRKEAFKKVVS